jgi:3-phenylpropionate/trans-cinnamate dioxygenase ferredoxin reductase component
MTRDIVIVGGGLAAQRCSEGLRRGGWDGPIRMICAERHPPYDRPPLSKVTLADLTGPPALRPAEWYRDHGIDLLLGSRAEHLDVAARQVRLAGGHTVRYEQLLVATGADPVVPPLLRGYGNVHTLRDVDDAQALRAALGPGRRLAVIGAGFLGLEVAATARELGTDVDVIDVATVPLGRVLPNDVGSWFETVHREEGVKMHLGDAVAGVQVDADEVRGLLLASGIVVACDAVLVAIGVHPASGWLGFDGAMTTDGHGRTVLPAVFAAGDVAAWPDAETGAPTWSQQWEAAAREGAAVAKAMLGLPAPPPTAPFFWTDQYGMRVQQLGNHLNADTMTLDGTPGERDFSVTWHAGRRVVGGLLVNRPRELGRLRSLIGQQDDPKGGDHELQSVDR